MFVKKDFLENGFFYDEEFKYAQDMELWTRAMFKLNFSNIPQHLSKHQYLIVANSTFSLWAYYFGMNQMKKFYFPLEWAASIQNKGYKLFSDYFNNIELIGKR